MLELKNISKQFGQKKIFDQFNLTIEDGKILSLVGPSGGGKTTLLRMLAGLETIEAEITMVPSIEATPDEGHIKSLQKMLDTLEEDDDVQKVYTNSTIDLYE